jgi:hypothetical protein
MRSDWQADAKAMIAAIHAELPADATLVQRRSELRKAASSFHMGTSHGKKTWSKHARVYLEKHGQLPRTRTRNLRDQPGLADDIIFPFSKGTGA